MKMKQLGERESKRHPPVDRKDKTLDVLHLDSRAQSRSFADPNSFDLEKKALKKDRRNEGGEKLDRRKKEEETLTFLCSQTRKV